MPSTAGAQNSSLVGFAPGAPSGLPEVLVLREALFPPSRCLPCSWGLEPRLRGVLEGRTLPAAFCMVLEKREEESGQGLTCLAGLRPGPLEEPPVSAQHCVGEGLSHLTGLIPKLH